MANQSKATQHWADATAERIVRQRGERDRYVLAAGITPSGPVHFGNVREIITPELVARALRRLGYAVSFIYLWDDYDRFRRVPANLPGDGWERYVGVPLSEIPDPYGASASYARHFAGVFEQQMARVGIEPEWISQARMYGSGAYAEGVRTALGHRQRLREILDRQRTTPLAADWWPMEVYCACGAGGAGTTVLSWDGAYELTYRCAACDAERVADLRRGDGVKLGWRVDWPMRWAHHGVDFEAAGKDHHTAGGSWETAAPIAGEVFGTPPPATLKFDWINVRGVGTMASSSGQLISVADALAVYQPEVVRYLFARTRPDREFEISFDLDVLKTYEDYDRAGRICRGTEQASAARRAREERAIELSEVDPERPSPAEQVAVSFRHLCSLLQIHDGDIDGVVQSLSDGAACDRLHDRARCAWHWITTHAPEGFRFRTTFGIPDVQVRAAHRLVAGTLASAGADLLCIETMFSATEAAIAVDEARAFGLPIAVNLTLKYTRDRKSGTTVYRTDWGHSCADLLDLLASGRYATGGDDLLPFVDVVGVNCGAEQRRPEHTGMPYAAEAIRQLQTALPERAITGKRLMAYPNAGMPRIVAGATHYDHPPERMASQAPEVVAAGASIVGGCCGTGPEHIRAIRAALAAG